jgi:hypothetical protein
MSRDRAACLMCGGGVDVVDALHHRSAGSPRTQEVVQVVIVLFKVELMKVRNWQESGLRRDCQKENP